MPETARISGRGVTTASPETALNALAQATSQFVRRIDRVQQLVVVRTGAGKGTGAGARHRRRASARAVGTIGGDDTILIVAKDGRRAAQRQTPRGLRSELMRHPGVFGRLLPARRFWHGCAVRGAEVVTVTVDLGQGTRTPKPCATAPGAWCGAHVLDLRGTLRAGTSWCRRCAPTRS